MSTPAKPTNKAYRLYRIFSDWTRASTKKAKAYFSTGRFAKHKKLTKPND